jgi:type IV pilus assembly protein PilA
MNNKGFSLVELIIVIAIMAILIVVLAPQYLKYVEKSRNSTDISNATEIVTALQVYASDPDVASTDGFTAGKSFKITVSTSAAITGDNSTAATKALEAAAISLTGTSCQSKNAWETYAIEGTANADGSITFVYSQTGGTDSNAFKNRMEGKSGS